MNLHSPQTQAQPTAGLESTCFAGPRSSEDRVALALEDLSRQISLSLHSFHAGLELPEPLGTALISARDAQLSGGPALFRTLKALATGHLTLVPSMHSAQSPELNDFLQKLTARDLHPQITPQFINRRLFLEINVLHASQLPVSE